MNLLHKIKWQLLIGISVLLIAISYFIVPDYQQNTSYATVILDVKGGLLGAKVADDGQWRFPPDSAIAKKFEVCITLYEDKRFFSHWGIDPMAIGRAMLQNIRSGRIVSGGSTITMQLARLQTHRKGKSFVSKIGESLVALRTEVRYSKHEILRFYAAKAPFGGNIVGLEAASWRYFGRQPIELSWAETALLAVLPNDPSRIFPGHNEVLLKRKRDNLLKKLWNQKQIDESTYQLSLIEPIPNKPLLMPRDAPHLLEKVIKDGHKNERVSTTIDPNIQNRADEILRKFHELFAANGIFNGAVLVLEVETGKTLAYVGNVETQNNADNAYDVDLIQSQRSTGSILKPFLFAMNLNEGRLLSASIVPDIPTMIGGYAPKNHDYGYDGAVMFKTSLSRSLNVPSVRVLQEYGIEKFKNNLNLLGITTLSKPASHYGLSIILGGGEATLWDLCSTYASMARSLGHFNKFGSYFDFDYRKAIYASKQLNDGQYFKYLLNPKATSVLSASCIWFTFEAMNEVSRPDLEKGWKNFSSSVKLAWKTGTSFGNRDAWAIGCNPDFVVGVWIGNADGEGRHQLTGINCAAPVMFEVFRQLGSRKWFEKPVYEMISMPVCKNSGFKAGDNCESLDTILIQKNGANVASCGYCKTIFLDKSHTLRVNSSCEPIENMLAVKWFCLPPTMELYYNLKSLTHKKLPQLRHDCTIDLQTQRSFEIMYPLDNSKIFVPKVLEGNQGSSIFQVANQNVKTKLFWHLDNNYVGSTLRFHQMAFSPSIGKHILNIVNELGENETVRFEVVGK